LLARLKREQARGPRRNGLRHQNERPCRTLSSERHGLDGIGVLSLTFVVPPAERPAYAHSLRSLVSGRGHLLSACRRLPSRSFLARSCFLLFSPWSENLFYPGLAADREFGQRAFFFSKPYCSGVIFTPISPLATSRHEGRPCFIFRCWRSRFCSCRSRRQ